MASGRATNFWQSLNTTTPNYGRDLIVEGGADLLGWSPEKPWNLFEPQYEEETEYSMWSSHREIFQHSKFEAGGNRNWSSSNSDSAGSDYFSGDFSGMSLSPRNDCPSDQDGTESFVNGSDHIVVVLSDCYSTLCDFQWDRHFVESLIALPSRGTRFEAKEFFPEIQKKDILEVISLCKVELGRFHNLLNQPDRCSAYGNLIQTLKSNFIKEDHQSRDYYSHLSYTWDQDNQLLKSWETTQGLIYQYVSSSMGSSREPKLDWLSPILENLAKIILQVRLNLYKTLSEYNFEEINGKPSLLSIKLPYRATDPVLLPESRFPPSRKPKYVPSYRPQSSISQRELRKSF
ncbi:unnamed protein product [Allacma fusca]|uniref:Uncharacterized protein n=1 Tax=Allacma fusca TaxID=39272 RepID=A0A8J2NPV0_9HEXA|nr:unnamed protein product [Allacma fusca]